MNFTKISLIYVIGLTLLISCDDQFGYEPKESESLTQKQPIEAQLQEMDVELSDQQLKKVKKIAALHKEYGLSYQVPSDGWLHVFLEIDLEDIELYLKEIEAQKRYTEKIGEITRKWSPLLNEAESHQELDSLQQKYRKEITQARKDIFSNVEPFPWQQYTELIQKHIDDSDFNAGELQKE